MSDHVVMPDDAEALARSFHENYERLASAPRFASAVPWENVPDKGLMIATAQAVLDQAVPVEEGSSFMGTSDSPPRCFWEVQP